MLARPRPVTRRLLSRASREHNHVDERQRAPDLRGLAIVHCPPNALQLGLHGGGM